MGSHDRQILADIIRRHKAVYEMDGATLASVAESIATHLIHDERLREVFYEECGMPDQEWAV